MTSLYLRLFLRWCHLGLALVGMVAFARLGYVAWHSRPKNVVYTPVPSMIQASTESSPLGPRSIQQALLEKLRMNPAPLPSELINLELAPSSTAPAAVKSPPVTRIYLAIHQGPARSEIRLNGVSLGHTPYVGEITCKRGEPLEFVLIPPKGMPRRSSHVCDRTEITITDNTRDDRPHPL